MNRAAHLATPVDAWVPSPHGRLFTRTWSPRSTPSAPLAAPIVLLHDSLGCAALWRSFPAALCAATGRQVIAYDRLGFGQSAPHPGALTMDFIAREAKESFAAVLQGLNIDRFALFGHSVGGGMAVNCAASYPGACIALVTESAQAFLEDRTIAGLQAARELFKDPEQIERLKKYHGDKAEWVLNAWIETWLAPAFATWSLAPILPQVHCPVLAIHGADDEYGTSKHPELIEQLAGGPAQVEIMADTRHVPHREREDAVVARVAAFLRPLD
ncbi:MAG: alpha/beta hydrolase [Burkholderiales bacterium]|nr:alpha/beta hydrolase [Burkholderiales bacterium]